MNSLLKRTKGAVALSLCLMPLCMSAAEWRSTTFESDAVAHQIRSALGDPARFNWEEVKVKSFEVSGGAVRAEVAKEGEAIYANIQGNNVFTIVANGTAARDSTLRVEFTLKALETKVSLATRHADVDVLMRVQNAGGCRMWTRAKHQSTLVSKITFRMYAIPQAFDVDVKMRLRVSIRDDGTVVLTPIGWGPANPESKIDIKMSGQKLPDGWAVIKPLNADTVRVDMDMPFDAGDRTIQNPLKKAMEKIIGKDFPIGKLAQ